MNKKNIKKSKNHEQKNEKIPNINHDRKTK